MGATGLTMSDVCVMCLCMCVCVSKLTSASRTKIVRVQLKRVPKRDCSQRFDSVYDSSNSIIVIIMGLEIIVK